MATPFYGELNERTMAFARCWRDAHLTRDGDRSWSRFATGGKGS